MDPGALFPIAGCAIVVLIVAITHLTRIHDLESEVRHRLHVEEMDHQRKMKELNHELRSISQGSGLRTPESRV